MDHAPTADAAVCSRPLASPPSSDRPGLLGWLNEHFEKPFLFLGMLAIILITTFQTAYRYVVSHFTPDAGGAVWTGELARFLFIWTSYLAIPLAIKNRTNIRVDVVYDRLPARMQRISWIVVDVCCLALTLVVLYMGVNHIALQMKFPQTTAALQVPYFVPYLILPVAFGLMTVRLLQDLVAQVKVTGLRDSLIGVACCALVALPLVSSQSFHAPTVLFAYLVLFMVVGVPIAISLGLAALATIVASDSLPVEYVAQIAFTSIDSFPIMAIPFFIAAGVFMGAGGLSRRLLDLADELLGSLPGGMALATIATCMFFAAISGSGPATVAAIGCLTIPAMVERGYDKYFAAAVVAAAGAIGVMIPPSNPFVVYSVASQVSIAKLFIAGIIPGLLTGVALMVFSYVVSKRNGWKGVARKRTLASVARAFWNAKLALIVPVMVLGGIYGGLMTPTEAAALAAFYGLIVGVFVFRELNLTNIVPAFMQACSTSATVIILMAMATIFGTIMTIEEVPQQISAMILGLTENKIAILLMINLLLLAVGTFMDTLAAIVIVTPILLPMAKLVGVDPLHFGVIMVVNLAIGFVTPPVGVNLFVASGVAQVKIERLSKTVLPLLLLMIAVLMFVTYVPSLSLMLVR